MSISVTFDVVDHLSFSMAHNRFAVFSRIEVINHGESVDAAQIVVEIRDHHGPVSRPWSLVADLAANATLTLTEVPATLDPDAMWQVDDMRVGRVVVRVMAGEDELAATVKEVSLLPGNHWLSRPPGLAFELLPSFVLPNDPAIATLLREASAILQEETGSPSMEGYQSGTERVDQIVAAIWTAAQRRQIRYAEPPASWGTVGQKVRTPAEVLDSGIGTCLDTTVVLAAALEQAGVRPLIWVLVGHAFLGYWREEAALDANAVFDGAEVINDVDRRRMRLLETTVVTAGRESVSTEEAHRLALAKLHDLETVQAVVDVWVARHNGVLPLPVRVRTANGVEIHEYRAATHQPTTVVVQGVAQPDPASSRLDVPARVQQWKNSLLDLTLRNRLINYTTRSGVSLVVPEGRLGTVEDLISASRPLTMRPADNVDQVDLHRGISDARSLPQERLDEALVSKSSLYTDVTTGGYATRMRGIAYKARTIVEETGANNLYLALGSLSWSIDGKHLRSPLVLVPVTLTAPGRGVAYRIQLDESGASTPNYCLLEKLRTTHGLTIPLLENPEADDSGIDLEGSLDAVRSAIASKGLPFRVEETADLAILQFAKFRLWKDLDENWAALASNSLVDHLITTPNDEFKDPVPATPDLDLDALDARCPIPADASQLEAVADAVAGRTFVLEGPPGTGKSQTITNLLTRAVAEGKRVLFVAEKRAALDVV